MSLENFSGQQVADDPELFADWVYEYIISSYSYGDDMELAPSEEQCSRLIISEIERQLVANEFILLRALGACFYVRYSFNENYYLKFKEKLLAPVAERMKKFSPCGFPPNTEMALEEYLEELKSDNHVGFSTLYIGRVYPDTPSSGAIYQQGIPVFIGLNQSKTISEATKNGYTMLKTGLSLEAVEALNRVEEDT